MKFGFGLTMLVAYMVFIPSVHAFSQDSVDRSGVVSTDGYTAAFSLNVMIGGFKEDIYVPAIGERDVDHGTRGKTFGYHVESGYPHAVSNDGVAQVLAISSVADVDGLYKIPAGTYAPFSFVGLLKVATDESNIYRLRINELPFFIGDDRSPRHFSTGELQYLVTNYEAVNFEQDPE